MLPCVYTSRFRLCNAESFYSSLQNASYPEVPEDTPKPQETSMYKGNNVAETRPVQVHIYKHVEEYRINVVHHRSYKIQRSERALLSLARDWKWRESTRWRGSRRGNIRQVCHALPDVERIGYSVNALSLGGHSS